VDLSDNPDFAAVANAFGIGSRTVDKRKDGRAGLEWLLATDGPALLHVLIDSQENVWPLVPPGKANHEMMTAGEIGL
jgi:acetolactate synthase-1/2/3 large subunit